MANDVNASVDQELILRDVRSLLDQLQLDPEHSLTLQSRLTDDLGVDSLALVELCDQLERTFDVSLPDEVFLQAATPQQWLEAIEVARGGPAILDALTSQRPTEPNSVMTRVAALFQGLLSRVNAARRSRAARSVESRSSGARADASASSVLYGLYAWVLLVPFALSLWLLAVLPLSLAQRRVIGRAIAKSTCRALGISVKIEGDLPDAARPSVIAANHSSFIDGLMLNVFLDQPVTFVASTDMEHQILLGRIMKAYGCVFVDRGRADRGANSVEKLIDTIHLGKQLLIFPEGSISERPGLRVFRLGAFEAAAASHCPVVPVGIRGTRDILRPGSFRPHRGQARVLIGLPVMPAGQDFVDRVALRDQVRDAIARLSGEDS